MELLTTVGVLWQRRIVVALGMPLALFAVAVAGLLPFGPGSIARPARGIAETRVLLDHRKPIVADLAATSETVGTQAALLAELMTGDAQRDVIARSAGMPASELRMERTNVVEPVAPGQLATRAADAAATNPTPSVISVSAAHSLPVLTIGVVAPSAAIARRVAGATRETLQAVVAARAPTEQRSIVVRPLGSVRSAEVPEKRRSALLAVSVAIAFLAFWCCAVVVLQGAQRVWRQAAAPPPATTAGY